MSLPSADEIQDAISKLWLRLVTLKANKASIEIRIAEEPESLLNEVDKIIITHIDATINDVEIILQNYENLYKQI